MANGRPKLRAVKMYMERTKSLQQNKEKVIRDLLDVEVLKKQAQQNAADAPP